MLRGFVRPFACLATAVLLAVTFVVCAPDARGQLTAPTFSYQSTEPSQYIVGCVGPSTCFCLAVFINEVEGEVDLTLDPLSIGPLFDYDIDVVLTFPDTATNVVRMGSGNLIHNATNGTVFVTLDLDINDDGVIENFTTDGFDPAPDFPQSFEMKIYAPQGSPVTSPCIYDGIELTLVDASARFLRGDANDDGNVNIADPIRILEKLFSGEVLVCDRSADIDDSGELNLVDPLSLLGHLFVGGPPPPAPYPACGVDLTPDTLDCSTTTNCAP